MKTQVGRAVIAAGLLASAPSSGLAQVGQCLVNFDNLFALTNTYAQARSTFAVPTAAGPEGGLRQCADNDVACWIFRHRCVRNYVELEDASNYNHFHLSFTDPGFSGTCGFEDPRDGFGAGMKKRVGEACVTPDWAREPRMVNTHDNAHWLRFWMSDPETRAPAVFGMQTIRIGDWAPVELWFHNTDDEWWYWDELAPNWWDVSRWMQNVDEVRFRAADGSLMPVAIEDFQIID